MFRGTQIKAYFSKVGTSKLSSLGGSSSIGHVLANRNLVLGSSSANMEVGLQGSEGIPIVISEGDSARSRTGVGASSSRLHAYPIDDPRYVHVPRWL